MLLFIPLEPDLGSRIVELESSIHKRLSRRDSSFCLVEHTPAGVYCLPSPYEPCTGGPRLWRDDLRSDPSGRSKPKVDRDL